MTTPSQDPTEDLLQQVGRGDPGAIDRLFTRHRDWLVQLIEFRLDRRVQGRVDTSDIVQEALMDASRRLELYLQTRPMPFRLWLRQITYDHLPGPAGGPEDIALRGLD